MLVRPTGIVATEWPAVLKLLTVMGIVFDEWQVGLAKLMLAKRADGKYAADTVVASIPRQVGKSFFMGSVIFALCLLRPGSTWLWTAHRRKTANETFRSMKGLAQQPLVKPFIERTPSSGEEHSIIFRNGSRILFGARERGFGRGFADVDGIVFDEAQILTQDAVDDMVPATSVAENPLVVFTGTPPRPVDPGEMFSTYRREAMTGVSDDVLYVEMSARRGSDPLDHDAWREANPSFPVRTTERSIMRLHKLLARDSFVREVLGIWDEVLAASAMPTWGTRRRVELRAGGRPDLEWVVGASCTKDRGWASIGVASVDDEGRLVVGLVDRREGTGWVRAELARLQGVLEADVVLDKSGPFAELVEVLEEEDGLAVVGLKRSEWLDACALVAEAVTDGELVHPGHPDLDAAVKAASWKRTGKRREFDGDAIDALEAVTVAAQQARQAVGFNVY